MYNDGSKNLTNKKSERQSMTGKAQKAKKKQNLLLFVCVSCLSNCATTSYEFGDVCGVRVLNDRAQIICADKKDAELKDIDSYICVSSDDFLRLAK